MSPSSREHPGGAGDVLLDEFHKGAKPALARVVSIVENHRSGFDRILAKLHGRVGQARRVGITGPPGAGKSTLTASLVARYRAAGATVGVIAVDPTSPFTGGALLGDRIRMESVALDAGVFIRSMATRGSLGGLAEATGEVADVLDAFGMDRVIIETVGVGQSELDVSRITDTTAVVLVPESGDSIQTLKAGLMEIADIFVVNKSDRPGADRLKHEIELMIGLRSGETLRRVPPHGREPRPAASPWTPAVIGTVASNGTGVEALMTSIDGHFDAISTSGELEARRHARLRRRVEQIVEGRVRRRLWNDPAVTKWLDEQLPGIVNGTQNPFDVADALLARSGDRLSRPV